MKISTNQFFDRALVQMGERQTALAQVQAQQIQAEMVNKQKTLEFDATKMELEDARERTKIAVDEARSMLPRWPSKPKPVMVFRPFWLPQ